MVATRKRTFKHYVERIKRHLLRKYPDLEFRLVMRDNREGTIYYSPYSEDEDWNIVHRTSGIAVDALIKDDYVIHIQPAADE